MKNFPPNIDPELYSLIAVIIGVFTASDFDDYELNAIGNWIILVGQYLLTYASQMQLIESRIDNNNININSKQFKSGGSPYINGTKSNQNQRLEVDYLINVINEISIKLNELKK